MDLLQKDAPILAKIYEAKCFYDSQNNRILLYYKNHVTSRTLVDFYNLPTTPPPNSSLYVIYDLQTGTFNVNTNPPAYTVSNSKVHVTSPINAEYDLDKVIIYRINWYEIDTAIDANYILTQLSTFVRKHQADTITATHTFDPTEPGPAFQLGPNARNQLIEYLNADTLDGFHASQTAAPNTIPVSNNNGKISIDWLNTSQTPAPNTIPVSNNNGKISIDWFPQGIGSNLNADTLDDFHASQTPTANTIPVANATGKIHSKWIDVYSLVPYWRVSIDETSSSRSTPASFTVSRVIKYMSYGTIFWFIFEWGPWSALWEMRVRSPSALSITGKVGDMDDNTYIYLNNNLVVSASGYGFKNIRFTLNLVPGDNLIQIVYNSYGSAARFDVEIDFDWRVLEFVPI